MEFYEAFHKGLFKVLLSRYLYRTLREIQKSVPMLHLAKGFLKDVKIRRDSNVPSLRNIHLKSYEGAYYIFTAIPLHTLNLMRVAIIILRQYSFIKGYWSLFESTVGLSRVRSLGNECFKSLPVTEKTYLFKELYI